MLKHITLSLAVVTLGLTAPLLAQSRSTVSGTDLDAAVAARPVGNRDAVRQFLATDQAQAAAARMGVNPAELSAQVGTLDQASLDQLAQRTGVGDPVLAGGDEKIVVSATVVIIALLIIILLVK
jgi:hypothetical protein